MRSIVAVAVLLASCGPADPCASVSGEPSLVLGGADASGAFEAFDPGAPRQLVLGPQGGMHVFLHARIAGLCPDTTVLERRVIDDASEALSQFGRGPVDFVETGDPGVFELSDPVAIILCPRATRASRARARAALRGLRIDDEGRRADAELAFVAACPDGVDCDAICAP